MTAAGELTDRPLSLSQSRREANERITARISSDHGLTPEDRAAARGALDRLKAREHEDVKVWASRLAADLVLADCEDKAKRRKKGDRMAVGE